MSLRRRHQVRWLMLALFGLGVLSACTVSVPGGLVGGGLAGLLGMLLLFSTAQTGCVEDTDPEPDPDIDVGACLSIAPDVGPCLSPLEPDIGPCLGAPLEDAGPDARIGPCLSPPAPDFGPPDAAIEQDARIGPCLDVAADAFLSPDADQDIGVGPCLEPPLEDAGPDAPIGPCLSPPEGDFGAQNLPGQEPVPGLPSVDEIREKVLAQGNLPPDVVARLKGKA